LGLIQNSKGKKRFERDGKEEAGRKKREKGTGQKKSTHDKAIVKEPKRVRGSNYTYQTPTHGFLKKKQTLKTRTDRSLGGKNAKRRSQARERGNKSFPYNF